MLGTGCSGCSGEVAGTAPEASPRVAVPAPTGATEPACVEPSPATLAVLGEGCGVAVVGHDGGWTLRRLEEHAFESPVLSLAIPTVCQQRPCQIGGGSVGDDWWVLAGVSSPDSELVEDLWLVRSNAPALDLWVEPAAYGDGTWLGPAHELWPHDCEGQVALLPRARFDDGSEGGPSAETRGAAQWLTGEESEAAQRPLPDASSCRPLALESPA